MRKIIGIISASENCGKTSLLRELIKILIKGGRSFQFYKLNGEAIASFPSEGDCIAIGITDKVPTGDINIGICTFGDDAKKIPKLFNLFEKNNCQVMIVAAKTSMRSNSCLKFAIDYAMRNDIWHFTMSPCTEEPKESNKHKKLNEMWAEMILKVVNEGLTP